tara:strand:- start:160 stop:417 length:258 start_codon:yes stop_codon:yes gene_type:complete
MATNDFIQDLVEKISEDNIEYMLVTVQKGKKDSKSNAYFNITTVEGADLILTTVDEVFKSVEEDTHSSSDIEDIEDIDDDDLLNC